MQINTPPNTPELDDEQAPANHHEKKRLRLLSLATIKKYKMRTWLRNKHNIDIRSLKTSGHGGDKHLSDLIKCNIEKSYKRDDVSKMTAGRHETVTKDKIKIQRRYLKDTIVNLYKMYNESNPQFKVSRATFYKAKPFWVLKPKVDNRETVECQRCSNLQFMVNILNTSGTNSCLEQTAYSHCSVNRRA